MATYKTVSAVTTAILDSMNFQINILRCVVEFKSVTIANIFILNHF